MSVFACIAAHGDVGLEPSLGSPMEGVGRRFDAAAEVQTAA